MPIECPRYDFLLDENNTVCSISHHLRDLTNQVQCQQFDLENEVQGRSRKVKEGQGRSRKVKDGMNGIGANRLEMFESILGSFP